ncbi:hypothetical protein, partial [Mesorhizobium sp. BHbdii]
GNAGANECKTRSRAVSEEQFEVNFLTPRPRRGRQARMTDYMGSVDRARAWMYRGDNSLIRYLQGNSASWRGFHA